MNLKQYFNPIWRKARALKQMVLDNKQFQQALTELEDEIINAILTAVLEQVLRRKVLLADPAIRQINQIVKGKP